MSYKEKEQHKTGYTTYLNTYALVSRNLKRPTFTVLCI